MYEKYTRLLKEKGTNTKAFCDTMEVPESTMAMWKARWLKWNETREGKEPYPSVETVSKMAKFFGKPIEFLLED